MESTTSGIMISETRDESRLIAALVIVPEVPPAATLTAGFNFHLQIGGLCSLVANRVLSLRALLANLARGVVFGGGNIGGVGGGEALGAED